MATATDSKAFGTRVTRKGSIPSPGSLRDLSSGRRLHFSDTLPIDMVLAKWNQFGEALRTLFPRRARAWNRMALLMVKIAAYHKECWPGADWITGQKASYAGKHAWDGEVIASRKAFFKMVAFLEEQGLLKRSGAKLGGGRQTSNDYDLRGLMKWLMKYAKSWVKRRRPGSPTTNEFREEIDGVMWVKRNGAWQREMDMPKPPRDPLPPRLLSAAWFAS